MNPYNHQNNNQNNNQNRVRTFKHIQMALQNEEQTILRECIHALQYVNGEVIRFHPSSASASASASESLQQYDIDNEKNGVDIDIQKQTIQIRNGLLPFQIDPISKVEHKGTRLLSTSTGSKDALHVCCEAGWLYSRIMNYVQFIQSRNRNRNRNGNGYNNSRSSRSNVHMNMNMNIGVVPRALASALMKELQSYHLLLSSLETQLLRTYQQQQQQQRQPQSNSSNETMRNRELTCRQLMIQLRAPITQLRTMAIMVDGIEPSMNGGQLLTALYLHSIHGDMRHVELVNRILYSTSLPWYDLLYDWCMNGVLLSQSTSSLTNEFFIQENINSSSDDLWHGQFVLHKDQIPYLPSIGGGNGGLLTERLANEVLIVGKGINFIRKCLHDTKWSLDVQKLIPQKALDKFIQEAKNTSSSSSPPSISVTNNEELFQEIKKLLGFHYDSISSRRLVRKDLSGQCGEIITQSPLETTVAAAAQQVHKHILMSLFEEHHLLQHLQGLKEILFLGQGDFICTLMDGLHTEFESKDVDGIDGIFMHNMMGILQEAFRSTNAKFLPQFVLQRVYIKLLSPNDAKCHRFWIDEDASATEELNGWDIFSLGYEVDAPLTAVVHPSAMEKYDQVFNLLFRLKRIEWMLNSTWKQSTVLNHALQYMITKYGENALGPASSIKRDKEIPRMKRLLRTFSLTRQMMIHFVSNLQNYLMFEVLESGWKSLVTKLGNAKTLDEVISSHDEYLDEIVTKSLLTETLGNGRVKKGTDALGRQLRLVLTVAYNFCKSHEKVFSDALQSIDKATEKRRGAERRSKAGKWGFDKLDPDVEGQHFFKLSDENTLQEILSISQDFDFSLRKLLSMLHEKVNGTLMQATINSPSQSPLVFLPDEEAPVHDDESLRYLTFRLDFSEFYST
jgi:gamma-tubulin complex component 3